MNRSLRITGYYVLTAFFLMVPGFLSGQGSNREKLQHSKKQIEEDIRYTNSLLEQTKKNRQSSLNRLTILNRQIEKRQSLIDNISKQTDDIQSQISVKELEIAKLIVEQKKMKEEYARMIYYAYKNMNGYNRLLFIFSAKDFNQAFARLLYYQQYSAYRRTQAQLICSKQLEISNKKKELEGTRTDNILLMQSKESEKVQLTQEKEEKDRNVAELSKKEKDLRASLKEKQKAATQLQIEIQKLIASEVRASAMKTRTSKNETAKKVKTSSEMMLTPVEMQLSTNFASNKGRLPWPSDRGLITGTFGEHPHPVLKYVKTKNNGIDISTEKGAAVKSVFRGKVSRVMSFPNLNKVVIIRHGEYLTVYSNLDNVKVTDGQEVSTRQVIGTVHTNSDDLKTELHFEIWLGKTIQNPQEWLSGAN
ncbi:MAG: peptidoglycan DD-metalloendopeptidase family protein [Bacteroidota bacterium]|nr:peptidoglycan DD-metalloendopeptidase family protein [Bacteroidota bacterium]